MLLLKLVFLGLSLSGCLELQHWICRSTLMLEGLWAHWIKLWASLAGPEVLSMSLLFFWKVQVYKASSKYILAEIWSSHRQNLIASHQARFEPSTPELWSAKPVWNVLKSMAGAIRGHTQRKTGHPTAGPAQGTSGPPLGCCLGTPGWKIMVTLGVLAIHSLIQRGMIQLGKVPGANWREWLELHFGDRVTMETWGRNSFSTFSASWLKNSSLMLWGESQYKIQALL